MISASMIVPLGPVTWQIEPTDTGNPSHSMIWPSNCVTRPEATKVGEVAIFSMRRDNMAVALWLIALDPLGAAHPLHQQYPRAAFVGQWHHQLGSKACR